MIIYYKYSALNQKENKFVEYLIYLILANIFKTPNY